MAAALGQTIRSVIQRQSRRQLGIYGSAFVRFIFGLPFSVIILLVVVGGSKVLAFDPAKEFFAWLFLASMVQIIFTIVLGYAFQSGNFATAIALSKTDALQAALFEMLLLSLIPDARLAVAISVGCVAIWLIANARSNTGLAGFLAHKKSLALGLLAGLCLGSCSVFFRLAMDCLGEYDLLERAILTSCLATVIQALLMGGCLMLWRPAELLACLQSWRQSSLAGAIAAGTTFMWFVAFSMMSVASVRMLGQIEIVLSLLFSIYVFKEKVPLLEIAGGVLITFSVIVLLS